MQTLSTVKATTLVVFATLAAMGCGRRSTPAQSVAELRSPRWEVRRAAADELRHVGPPPSTVPHLMSALSREKNAYTYGALLLALGKAGSPEALPYICGGVYAADEDTRRWAKNAFELWSKKNRGGCPPPGAPVSVFPGAPPPSAGPVAGPPAPPDWSPASGKN